MDDESTVDPVLAERIHALVEQRAPGWQLDVEAVHAGREARHPAGVEVTLTHPYSHGMGLFVSDRFTPSDVDARTRSRALAP